ncbi:MAG: hypothetical protein AAF108_01990 [Planctomycetota bacterium]
MSFGLGHGRTLDDAPGVVGIGESELGPLPDDVLERPDAARVDPRVWFAEPERPFELEIGSGKGTFLVQEAQHRRDVNFLGIEWAREFYLYAADRVRRHRAGADDPAAGALGSLTHVRMLHTDATQFIKWRVPPGICSVIHLYFSDPWPKTRHHKKRVIQDWTLAEFWRVLEPGGELRVVTDHDALWAWDVEHFDRWCSSESDIPGWAGPRPAFRRGPFLPPASAGDGELVGTNFERKFIDEGRGFHGCILTKLAPSPTTA